MSDAVHVATVLLDHLFDMLAVMLNGAELPALAFGVKWTPLSRQILAELRWLLCASCQQGQPVGIHLCRCLIVQRLMRTLVIVKHEVLLQALVSLIKRFIGFRIDLLIFDRPPEPFDKDMVMRPSSTIHTDPDPGLRQATGKGEAGELGALVGVEDHRQAVRQGLVQALQAKGRLQGIRQLPRQHFTAIPVQDRDQVDKPARQVNVGDIRTLHLIRDGHRHPAQQVGIDPMIRTGLRGGRLRVNRLQS